MNQQIDPIELLMHGGWIMLPIFLLSIIAIAIFIERYLAISRNSKYDTKLINKVKDSIQSGDRAGAIEICRTQNTPVARMLIKGIEKMGKPTADIVSSLESIGNIEVVNLEKKLSTLATVSGGAPMIGFLGTVIGMIQAFFDMANAGSNVDVTLLSGGIYQAMVTTAAGLTVGIFAYFGYNILVAKIDRAVQCMDRATADFIDIIDLPTIVK